MFVIINITHLEADFMSNECIIPRDRRPSYVHETEDAAQAELLRLSQRNPGNKFVLFTATHSARETTALVPTKVWAVEPIKP